MVPNLENKCGASAGLALDLVARADAEDGLLSQEAPGDVHSIWQWQQFSLHMKPIETEDPKGVSLPALDKDGFWSGVKTCQASAAGPSSKMAFPLAPASMLLK